MLRERLTELETAAARAPGDVGLVRAVLARRAADDGAGRAEAARDRADEELGQARAAPRTRTPACSGRRPVWSLAAPVRAWPTRHGLDERAGALQGAGATVARLAVAQAGRMRPAQAEERARALYTEAAQLAAAASGPARALRHADRDQDVADNAEETLDLSGRDLRQAAREQRRPPGRADRGPG